jgi:hypothetical protein
MVAENHTKSFLEGHEAVRAWRLYPREQDHRLRFEMFGEAWNLSIVLTIITFVNSAKNGTTLCAVVKVMFNNPLDMCNRNRYQPCRLQPEACEARSGCFCTVDSVALLLIRERQSS